MNTLRIRRPELAEPPPPTLDTALARVRRVAEEARAGWWVDTIWRARFNDACRAAYAVGATEAEITRAALSRRIVG